MGLHMPPPTGDFTPPPEGTHYARCYRVVDLGTQMVEWNGATKFQRKVVLSWELPTEKMEDGQPFSVHQRYTFSSSENSHFRKHLESWRGRKFEDKDFGPGGFHISKLLGVPCLLTVVHTHKNDRVYANVTAVAGLPKGAEAPEQINESVFFSLEPDEFNETVYQTLSDNLKETIQKSPEYKQAVGNGQPPEPEGTAESYSHDLDDEIPF